MCAIGSSKRTLDNIRREGIFSANLVVEKNLALADYFGTADGRDPDKMKIPVEWEEGSVLGTPILCSSPVSFELQVEKEIATGDEDQTVFLCRIRNTVKDEELTDPTLTQEEILKKVGAVRTCGAFDYWAWDGRHLGKWHERATEIQKDVEIGAAARGK